MKQIPSSTVTSWMCLSCGLGDTFLMHTFPLVISKHEHHGTQSCFRRW